MHRPNLLRKEKKIVIIVMKNESKSIGRILITSKTLQYLSKDNKKLYYFSVISEMSICTNEYSFVLSQCEEAERMSHWNMNAQKGNKNHSSEHLLYQLDFEGTGFCV